MKHDVSIVWFRLDLRLTDNLALAVAAQRGGPVIPVFIWAPGEEGAWPPGAASRWWLHHSLQSLAADLGGLVIRRGPSLNALRQLVKETGATAVFWNRRYEPVVIARDTKVKQALLADGLQVESFNSALLFEPWEIKNGSDAPYRVFTPFWRACVAKGINEKLVVTPRVVGPKTWPASLKVGDLELLPKRNWARGFDWQPGETGALKELRRFVAGRKLVTPSPVTAPTSRAHRGCHRIYTSARSRPGKCGRRRRLNLTDGNWCGESSPITCSTTSRTRRRSVAARIWEFSMAQRRQRAEGLATWLHRFPTRGCRHERIVDDRFDAQPLSAWLSLHSSSKTCSSRGRKARGGSGTRWWTPTLPTTRSGWALVAGCGRTPHSSRHLQPTRRPRSSIRRH